MIVLTVILELDKYGEENFVKGILAVLKDGLSKLNFILSKQQKMYGIIVLVMSMAGAVLETVGVGIVIPLVQMFLNVDILMDNAVIGRLLRCFHISSDIELIILTIIFIMTIFLIKNIYFMCLSWVRVKYSSKIERELSVNILNVCVKKGYMYFLNENNAEIMKYISVDTAGVNQLVYHFLRAITDICIILFVGIYLMITDYIIAVGVMAMSGLCILIVYGYFRKKMKRAGVEYNFYCRKTNQYLLQFIMGIKEIIVFKKQKHFLDKYAEAYTQRQNKYIQQTIGWEWPAYIIEGLCLTGLLGVLCFRILFSKEDWAFMVPMLSAFAIGAFRILPSLGRISAALNSAIYYTPSLNYVYEHLRADKDWNKEGTNSQETSGQTITFSRDIRIKNIYWKYTENGLNVLNGLSLIIPKGKSIGLVGKSGSGKTTLVDIILGIFEPQKGSVTIDNHDIFKENIDLSYIFGYISQNPYFSDDSLRQNIAYGIHEEEIEDEKVWEVLEQAQLKSFVENLPEKLDTLMGDNGLNFSGGQRQRVAIARALYHNPEILVFDEATSALDNETEKAIMEAIINLKGYKTLIIIAHRLTTIKDCDYLYEIKDGKAERRNYKDIIS